MNEYHKIQSLFKRDQQTNKLIFGDWTTPEFEYLANSQWAFTEKVDGTNIRVMWNGDDQKGVWFGGRTDKAAIPAKLVEHLQKTFYTNPAFAEFNCPVCLYGEGYGSGIQKGGAYGPEQKFVLFDVWVNGWWLQRKDVEDVASKFGIDVVPVIGHGTLFDAIDMTKAGFSSRWNAGLIAEGIVARPVTELCDRSGGRIIAKIKHRDFA